MKKLRFSLSVLSLVWVGGGLLLAQSPGFATFGDLLGYTTTPAVQTSPFGSYINPALGGTLPLSSSEVEGWAYSRAASFQDIQGYGLYYADGVLCGGFHVDESGPVAKRDLRFGLALGNRSFSLGYANISVLDEKLNFSKGFAAFLVGALYRPLKYLSLGGAMLADYQGSYRQFMIDGGLRPLGTGLLTLFGSWILTPGESSQWAAGVSVQPAQGFEVFAKYNGEERFSVGLSLKLDGVGAGSSYSGSLQNTDTLVGAGLYLPVGKKGYVFPGPAGTTYIELCPGEVAGEPRSLFGRQQSLQDILLVIRKAAGDPEVAGLILNLSNYSANQSDTWEIEQALEQFKKGGKKIVAFIDDASFDTYLLASVADSIVMDPQGTLTLEGYAVGRGYFKHTLEKLGIGFRELRYFTYKSAGETFSQDKLSQADREQYGAYLDRIYETSISILQKNRNLTRETIEQHINQNFLLAAPIARDAKLVDEIGRKEAILTAVERLSGPRKNIRFYGNSQLSFFNQGIMAMLQQPYGPEDEIRDVWGEPAHVAVVYALGSTSLDTGMQARSLAQLIDTLANEGSVKGIVVRIESLGGDAVAADYVAKAIRRAKEKKPVLVSMGSVAGSGGYWAALYGESLYATPYTITGSIGVIASWFYDKGLNQKIGASLDVLKRGAHADLNSGILLPYRDLTEDEVAQYKKYIYALYNQFVEEVAAGRNMSKEEVEQRAQGRIYSGQDAQEKGLVDHVGGLMDALTELRARLGIKAEDELIIESYPLMNPFAAFAQWMTQTVIQTNQRPLFTPVGLSVFEAELQRLLASSGTVEPRMSLEDLDMLSATTKRSVLSADPLLP